MYFLVFHFLNQDYLKIEPLDELLEKIGELISSDKTLSGLTDFIYPKPPEIIEEYIDGATLIKAAVIPVVLQYSTINPLK